MCQEWWENWVLSKAIEDSFNQKRKTMIVSIRQNETAKGTYWYERYRRLDVDWDRYRTEINKLKINQGGTVALHDAVCLFFSISLPKPLNHTKIELKDILQPSHIIYGIINWL